MNDILVNIVNYFSGPLGIAELAATILLVVCVYQLAHQNIWNFLWGSIGVIIYGWIFFEVKLYSDMLLQLAYFLPIQIFSAWYWYTKGPAKDSLPVVSITNIARISWIGIIGISSLTLGYLMATFTDASFPYWDALTTVMSVVAQYLMIKKIWESWIIWIVMDVIAINIYFYKGLLVTSGLYVVFLGLAVYGLIMWYSSKNINEMNIQISGAQ